MIRFPAVNLRVIPFDGTSFPATGHAVDYFHGAVPTLDTVEVDAAHGNQLDDPAGELEKYRLVLDRMEAVALKPAPSLDLVHRISQDLWETSMTEPAWQESAYSEEGSACVETAPTPTTVRIRDSKHPCGPHLTLRPTTWADFVSCAAEPGRRV